MLEEFGLYLDLHKDRKGHYMGMGKKVKPKELAVTLGISTEDLLPHYNKEGDIQVFFLNVFDFVDAAAISVFWVVKNQEVDSAPALLANVYYTLSVCHDKEIGSLLSCILLLYQWFVSHLYKDIYMVGTKGNHAWAQKLRSLNEKAILWYPKKINAKPIIINCGSFPNVTLHGKNPRKVT
ncbi:hypothetical protein KIW84_025310 [Lathyrus oleraceus]|uniref:DUF7745 domain-containing protein n=1 Tax=Pisum sativum TaxID=3888 RepID=A0A9D5BAJ8_PEA|nr:hypothetical protein KIW84_025310 [Pisum sativum]